MLKFRPVLQLTRSMISLSYEWRGDCDPPRRLAPIPRKTMLNIEKNSDGHKTTIRLIGRMQAEHLPALQELIKESRPRIALDLEQLTLVDVEAVRFLGGCRRNGMALLNCSPYIREWIAKEQKSGK